MKPKTLANLQNIIHATVHGSLSATPITNIAIDSRQLQPGELFVAIRGEKYDGHDFIAQAQARGAVAVIGEKFVECGLPMLIVNNSIQALAQLAQAERNNFPGPVVSVTGSCGKTTTKTMVANILSQRHSVLFSQSSFNNAIGLPLTLLRLTPEHEFIVLEMGANHFGEIAALTSIAQPQVAMITNIGPVHLEGFGDLAGVARAKCEIFQGLQRDGTAVIPQDDPAVDYISQQAAAFRRLYFGCNGRGDVQGKDIQLDTNGRAQFTLTWGQKNIPIHLPTLGQHHIYNALAAASAALAVGISLEEIKQGLETTPPVAKRLIKRSGFGGATIIDDSYNANLLAAKAAIQVLAHSQGEKVLIFGAMGELGTAAVDHHQQLGAYAKEMHIHRFWGVGELMRHAVDSFGEGGMFFNDKKELAQALKTLMHPNMTVLVKGSRSARMEEVVQEIMVEEVEN